MPFRDRSCDGDPLRVAHAERDHHALVLVLEVVAVEHVGLRAREALREIDRDAHAFAGPDDDRVEQAEVLRAETAGSDGARAHLRRTAVSLEHAELEAVQVYRVRHAAELVRELPYF